MVRSIYGYLENAKTIEENGDGDGSGKVFMGERELKDKPGAASLLGASNVIKRLQSCVCRRYGQAEPKFRRCDQGGWRKLLEDWKSRE